MGTRPRPASTKFHIARVLFAGALIASAGGLLASDYRVGGAQNPQGCEFLPVCESTCIDIDSTLVACAEDPGCAELHCIYSELELDSCTILPVCPSFCEGGSDSDAELACVIWMTRVIADWLEQQVLPAPPEGLAPDDPLCSCPEVGLVGLCEAATARAETTNESRKSARGDRSGSFSLAAQKAEDCDTEEQLRRKIASLESHAEDLGERVDTTLEKLIKESAARRGAEPLIDIVRRRIAIEESAARRQLLNNELNAIVADFNRAGTAHMDTLFRLILADLYATSARRQSERAREALDRGDTQEARTQLSEGLSNYQTGLDREKRAFEVLTVSGTTGPIVNRLHSLALSLISSP